MAGLGHVRSLDASARVVFFHFPAPTFHGPSTRETIKNRATTRILRGMVYDVGISLDKIVLTSDGFDDTHNETFPSRRRPSRFTLDGYCDASPRKSNDPQRKMV